MPFVLFVTGLVFLIIGALGLFALISEKDSADAAIALSGFVSGILFLALGNGLETLRKIEGHLAEVKSKEPMERTSVL